MASGVLIKDLQMMVQQMMKESCLEKYRIEIEEETGEPDGYAADMVFFSVTETTRKRLNLILKTAKRGEIFRKYVCADGIYDRELHIYSKVFPALKLFLLKKNLSNFLNFVPKSYFTSGKLNQESIILENLKYQNFRLWDRMKPMNLNHVRLVFENLGKWHGLTMAYRDQFPEKFSELVKSWIDVRRKMWEKYGIDDLVKSEFQIIMQLLKNCGRSDLVNIYRELQHRIDYLMLNTGTEDNVQCIVHGDCWINNFMFRYEKSEESIPHEVRFLDFQLSMVNSPIIDLSSFFYNVADKNSFLNFENLLTTYCESLSTTLKSLGSDPQILFPMTDLKRHWKNYGLFGVVSSSMGMKIQFWESDEAPDLIALAEKGESLTRGFKFESRNIKIMRDRVKDAYIHFGELLKFNKI